MNYYSIVNCQLRSYEEGVILTVRDAEGKMLGDIAVTPRKKVDKLELIHLMKSLLKVDDDFDTLISRTKNQLKSYVETMDIKLVF